MKILLTNDDGIYAPGLRAVYSIFTAAGHEVEVVAPLSEQSGVSGSLTLHSPLRIHEINEPDFKGRAVNGSPVDCIKIALTTLLPKENWVPDLVVSGINGGNNLGVDILYSGTIAAATEAGMSGFRGIALSRPRPEIDDPLKFAVASLEIIASLDWDELPSACVLNVNFPRRPLAEVKGMKVCSLAKAPWTDVYHRREDPNGRPYWWMAGYLPRESEEVDVDISYIRQGYITITPLQFDRTNHGLLEKVQWAEQ